MILIILLSLIRHVWYIGKVNDMFDVGDLICCHMFDNQVVILRKCYSLKYGRFIYLVEDVKTKDTMWVSESAFIKYEQLKLFDVKGLLVL